MYLILINFCADDIENIGTFITKSLEKNNSWLPDEETRDFVEKEGPLPCYLGSDVGLAKHAKLTSYKPHIIMIIIFCQKQLLPLYIKF